MKQYAIEMYMPEFKAWIQMSRVSGIDIPSVVDSFTEIKETFNAIKAITPEENVRIIGREVSEWEVCA